MRLILKVLLLPVLLVLALIVAVGRFLCLFSTILLSIVAAVFFFFAIGNFIMGDTGPAFGLLATAFCISTYGIPALVSWLVERVDDLRRVIKAI